ncbi:MAG: signal peptidase II [Dongiaceae bacterium]
MIKLRYRVVVFLLVMGLAALADQGVKAAMVERLAGSGPVALAPVLNLRLGYNTGVSFSMFAETFREAPWLLAAIKIGIVAVIAGFAVRTDRRLDTLAFGLIAGGATGNIIDRFRIGAVVDYIDLFYAGWHWPTFNLADALIFLGVALLLAGAMFAPRRRRIAP